MAGVFICELTHPDAGLIKVYEAQNGARVYGFSDKLGTIPFQDKKRQNQLRGLVIAEGYGQYLKRKPSALEMANHAPEIEHGIEELTVSVLDKVQEPKPEQPEATPEEMPEQKKSRIGFGWGRSE